MTNRHFTTDELREYARGSRSDDLEALVEHCKDCARCGDQLAVLLDLGERDNSARRAKRPCLWMAAPQPFLRILQATATVAIFVLIAVGIFVAANQASAPIASTYLQLATSDPLPEMVVHIHLGKTVAASTDPRLPLLQRAGLDIAEARYDRAVPILEELREGNPADTMVAAYLGIALYLLGDDSERTAVLLAEGAAHQNLSVATFTQWYLANYFVRTGQVDEAIAVLESLARRPTMPGRNAVELLSKLGTRPADGRD